MSEDKTILMTPEGLRREMGMKGLFGRVVSRVAFRLLDLDKANKTHAPNADKEGPAYAEGILKTLGITYDIPPSQLDYIPAEGGFITVSNHHFGGADGLILNAVFGKKRPDMKILTTFLLSYVRNLKSGFIPVDNLASGGSKSITGIRTALQHIADGHPLGLFPAGEVATWQKQRIAPGQGRIIEDKPWAENMMKLILRSGFPVIPVYFDGVNSLSWHRLGRIHRRLRTLRLPHQLFNKAGTHIAVRIGKPISAEEIRQYDAASLARYLRNRTYALEAQCKQDEAPAEIQWKTAVASHMDPEMIRAEVDRLGDKILFDSGDYRVFLIKAEDAPTVMQEIYRLREETFRAIGEGTGEPLDTDSYDTYYRHLVLWHRENRDIVGAYRLGFGSEIFTAHGGQNGFYTSTLFRFVPCADATLKQSIELGRSFIVQKYQREILPLKLLLAGVSVATTHCRDAAYCLGPVSVSNSIPDFYKSLMVHYISRRYRLGEAEGFVFPTNPFRPDFLRVRPDDLLDPLPEDIDVFDRLLATLSDGRYRVPILLKKYINCGARIACFNVDPLFMNSLDGFIVQKLSDFPLPMLRSFMRPVPPEVAESVYKRFYGPDFQL